MVVVFGSVNADLVARVRTLPREGETQLAEGYAIHAGGKGANQALAACRAGARVILVGAVGNDGHAEFALAPLRAAGADLSRVRRDRGPTGIAFIHVDAAGRNTITVVPGANAQASADDLPTGVLADGAVVVAQLEVPVREVAALFLRARAAGARTLLNFAPPAPLAPGLLEATGILVVNEHEAAALAGQVDFPNDAPAFCEAYADRHGGAAVVTLGAGGAVGATPTHRVHVPAPTVDVRDTTAAGDAFVGALAAALDRDEPFERALVDAVAAGSHACTIDGAQPSIGARAAWSAIAARLLPCARIEPR